MPNEARPSVLPRFSWRGLLRVVHPFPSLLVAGVTAALVPLADPDADLSAYVVLGGGMLLFQFGIGATNDLFDAADDAVAKPGKPIPSGRITPSQVRFVAAACVLAGLGLTSVLPLGAWLAGIAGLACGLAYDGGIKRTPLSWLPLAFALPLVPAWVFLALDQWDPFLWWVFPLGLLFGIALHFANEMPDIAPGSQSRSAVHLTGPRRAFSVTLGAFGVAASVACVVLAFEARPNALLAAVAGISALSLSPRAVRLFGRDGLFGLLAASTAVIALAFIHAVP